MVERKRIGVRFSYNENWIAGSYYILNIIHALNTLDVDKKPIIVVLSENIDNFNIVKNETQYPFLEYFIYPFLQLKYSIAERVVNKIGSVFINKKIITKTAKQPKIDFLYPNYIDAIKVEGLKKVNWIPDFQEEHLPQFFSKEEISRRKHIQKEVYSLGDLVVLSSNDARNDYNKLYPNAKAKPYVLSFAVTHPDFKKLSSKLILEKYKLASSYFFSPNQFWAHKNHIVVLKAVKYLKDLGVHVIVAFSGKETDFRNAENFNSLKSYVKQYELEKHIRFLGFIDREEQLCLLDNSIAVIQPSLFEGWSTVVEDARALNKFIILSGLDVHQEQINENVHFFNPKNEKELAKILNRYYVEKPKTVILDYKNNIKEFANKFIDLVEV
jgi:glycosyltransferase involved in cell wall biosynthesis